MSLADTALKVGGQFLAGSHCTDAGRSLEYVESALGRPKARSPQAPAQVVKSLRESPLGSELGQCTT